MSAKYLKNPKDPEVKELAKELLKNPNAKEWMQQELDARKKALPPETFKGLEETFKKYQETTNVAPNDSLGPPDGSQRGLANTEPSEKPSGPNAKENAVNNRPAIGMQSG